MYLCAQHLGRVVPDCVEVQEMICESCMNKNPFLWTYAAHLAGALSSSLCSPTRNTRVIFSFVLSYVSGPEVLMEEKRDESGANVPKKAEKVSCTPETRLVMS